MKTFLVVLLALALVGGCTVRGGKIGIATGMGVAALGGIVASNPGGEPQSAMGAAMMGAGIAVLGGIIVLGSVAGMAIGPSDDSTTTPSTRNAAPQRALAE